MESAAVPDIEALGLAEGVSRETSLDHTPWHPHPSHKQAAPSKLLDEDVTESEDITQENSVKPMNE